MIKNIQSRLTPISHEYPSCDECYASLFDFTQVILTLMK